MSWEKLGTAIREFRDDLNGVKIGPTVRLRNPHTNSNVRSGGFFSEEVGRLLTGWQTDSATIDQYLRSELVPLRARSRQMVRRNTYGKRFVSIMKNNIVGPRGVLITARSTRSNNNGAVELDTFANDALDFAFDSWGERACDFKGELSWLEMQNLAVVTAAQDGEFLFRMHTGPNGGEFGLLLETMDPQILDISVNQPTQSGEIRLGIEYNRRGQRIRYHFKGRSGRRFTVDARFIIHGYIADYAEQSRGIPWMHAGLERSKHLEKFDESAIVNARVGASSMGIIHGEGGEQYEGEEEGEGIYEGDTLEALSPGQVRDIGNREFTMADSRYPDGMYSDFTKAQLRAISVGWGISYPTLSGDLEGVNYSSIRAAVLEDREVYKGLQNWFIRRLVKPVREEWVRQAMLRRVVKVGSKPAGRAVVDYMPAHYQGRRWAWVDPQKDGQSNDLAIKNRTRSVSGIIRDQGDDPVELFTEISSERELMDQLGIAPTESQPTQPVAPAQEDKDDD